LITPETSSPQVSKQATDKLFLTFSAEELGKVAALIIKGVERKEAIRSMPRYTRKQHKEFAQFYDELKRSILEAYPPPPGDPLGGA
jgi:hypothetical protein